jgi:hypothetical protein
MSECTEGEEEEFSSSLAAANCSIVTPKGKVIFKIGSLSRLRCIVSTWYRSLHVANLTNWRHKRKALFIQAAGLSQCFPTPCALDAADTSSAYAPSHALCAPGARIPCH